MPAKVLTGVAYVLGDAALDYNNAEGFATVDMPKKPDLWGWGKYHQSSKATVDMKIEAARRAIASVGLDAQDVDYVISCQANLPEPGDRPEEAERQFLEQLGLENAFPLNVMSGGCSAMLAGVNIADGMLSGGQAQHIVVVAGDKTPTGVARFQRYGIYSDAACCCIVSSTLTEGFEIVQVSTACDHKSMYSAASFSSELASRTNMDILANSNVTTSDIKKVFCNNVFLPITMLKEVEAGFSKSQIYFENVRRIGHCYSSDALINLADYQKNVPVSPGEYFIAAADAPGLRCAVLLKATRTPNQGGDI